MSRDPIWPPRRDDATGIARELERVVERLRRRGGRSDESSARDDRLILTGEHYRRCRVQRAFLFDDRDPADPAWDILIDLYVAQVGGRDVSVTSAGIASLVPPTTGLRWINRLCAAGLTTREHDGNDGRRVLLRLTSEGEERVRAWLACLSGL